MKRHYNDLPKLLDEWAKEQGFRCERYSEYHMRILGSEFAVLDVWTTGKYYVLESDYYLYGASIVERGSEKGFIPTKRKQLRQFLNKLFYPIDFA